MKKTILALLLAGATWVTGCGSSNDFNQVSGQPGTPNPIITPTTTPTPTTGYFVDTTNGNDATASFSTGAPYSTIQAAVAAAPINALITVRSGTYTGSITLKNGQQLVGASGTIPVLTGTLSLADGNTVDFLSFLGTNGHAIDGDDQNGGTITSCQFSNIGNIGSAISIQSVTGSWTIEDNLADDVTGIGIDATVEAGDVGVFRVNGNTIKNCDYAAVSFLAGDNGSMRTQLNNNTFTDNATNVTVEVIVADTADAAFQIVGNTNDDAYSLSLLDSPAADLRVERLGQLTTLNSGGASVIIVSDPLDPAVPNGAAGFGNAP